MKLIFLIRDYPFNQSKIVYKRRSLDYFIEKEYFLISSTIEAG